MDRELTSSSHSLSCSPSPNLMAPAVHEPHICSHIHVYSNMVTMAGLGVQQRGQAGGQSTHTSSRGLQELHTLTSHTFTNHTSHIWLTSRWECTISCRKGSRQDLSRWHTAEGPHLQHTSSHSWSAALSLCSLSLHQHCRQGAGQRLALPPHQLYTNGG